MVAAGPSSGRSSYFDTKIGAQATIVLPGDHLVSSEPDHALVTLLGSCVAACIRDPEVGVGGLNHFLLPDDRSGGEGAGSMRYGTNAMEVLINDILKQGGSKSRLEAKVFGGGNVIDTSASETVGDRNARFVLDYLRREGVRVAASDLGGVRARRVFYFPTSGRVSVLRLEPKAVREQELRHKAKVETAPRAGGVELF
ncbi:MAG: chemotaxis protein CheD [Neomegalonema sp.]|nr:chemotaxis protein CheD [Neomegalonema sp.]